MIELYQFPWSPYCLVQKQILEYSGAPFKIIDVPSTDRSRVWHLTRQRYYQVPVIRDGRSVVFETEEHSQVIAKYLDEKFHLWLFPHELDGLQDLLWPIIENDIEALTFKLNDAYYADFVPPAERLQYVRFKERKFGRGCLEHWRREQSVLREDLARRLAPFELMLGRRAFLLDERPVFLDFDLYGMLANLTYTGRHRVPAVHPRLRAWFKRMAAAKIRDHNDC